MNSEYPTPELSTELDVFAWAILNWKTVASFIGLVLWIAKKHWDQNQLRKEFETFVQDFGVAQERKSTKDGKVADSIRVLDKELDRLKTSVSVDREYTAKSLDEFNSRLSTLMEKLIQGL